MPQRSVLPRNRDVLSYRWERRSGNQLLLYRTLGRSPGKSSMFDLRRREFITLLGGGAAWPLAARAQQPADKMRRIGMLLPASADNRDYQTWAGAFLQGLGQLGWNIGRNVQIDTRWATAHADNIRRHATELAGLAPDVIMTFG